MSSKTNLVAVVCLCFGMMMVAVAAFNPDRAIYKWSPLWFNNYIRRGGVLQKRFRDEPITKWSPATFRGHYEKRVNIRDGCAKENSVCFFLDEETGEPGNLQCCGGLQCVPTGDYYSCSHPGYRNKINEFDYIYE